MQKRSKVLTLRFFGVNRSSELVLTSKAPRIEGLGLRLTRLTRLTPKKTNLKIL